MLRKLIYEAGARMRNPSLMEQFDFLKKSDRWERAQLDYYQLEKMKSFLEFDTYIYKSFYISPIISANYYLFFDNCLIFS